MCPPRVMRCGVGLIEEGRTGGERDGSFHGVDEVVIFFAGSRASAHAEDAVFAVKIHSEPGGKK